jgi:ribosomal protein S6
MDPIVSTEIDDESMLLNEEPRLYECCILYPYPMPQKEEAQLLKEIDALFAEASAKLIEKDVWGRRGLAYPIKGSTEANVVISYHEMMPSKFVELDRGLRILKGVLRHMFVKPPKGYKILKYGELYEDWMRERESVEDKRSREREERLREQVAEKAKRRVTKKSDAKTAQPAVSKEELGKKLDSLMSDDSLNSI